MLRLRSIVIMAKVASQSIGNEGNRTCIQQRQNRYS